MRTAGFGCLGCGGLMGLGGLVGIVLAALPGVINSSETFTVAGPSGGLCALSFLPLLIGVVLVVLGGRRSKAAA